MIGLLEPMPISVWSSVKQFQKDLHYVLIFLRVFNFYPEGFSFIFKLNLVIKKDIYWANLRIIIFFKVVTGKLFTDKVVEFTLDLVMISESRFYIAG